MNDITTIIAIFTAISTPIGAALVTIFKWITPKIDSMFEDWKQFSIKMTEQNAVISRLATSLTIMTDIISLQRRALSSGRWILLIIEDNPIDRRFLYEACTKVTEKISLFTKDVPTLFDAYQHLPYTALIILDINLEDSDKDRANILIEVAGCPVIVCSSVKYEKTDFPNAASILCKDGLSFEIVAEHIQNALLSGRKRING